MNKSNFLTNPRYIFREDVSILFDSHSGVQHQLNEMACVIVSRLKGGDSVDEVVKYISEACDVDSKMVEEDVDGLLCGIENPNAKTESFEFEKNTTIHPSFPYAIEFELTRLCDWRCIFCYNVWKIDGDKEVIKEKYKYLDKESIFRVLQEGKDHGLLRVRYSGGEPTLHPNFDEIVQYAGKLNYYQVVFTNGRSVTNDTVSHWVEHNVKEVMISLHGDRKSHNYLTGKGDAYEKTINKIKILIENKMDVVVEMILTKQNYEGIVDVIEQLYTTLGLEQFRLMRYVPSGKKEDVELEISQSVILQIINDLESRYISNKISVRFPCSPRFCLSDLKYPIGSDQAALRKKYLVQHCNAGKNWLSISYDNKLRICPHSNVYQGHLSEKTDLKTLWQKNMLPKVLSITEIKDKECQTCSTWSDCKGGCHLSHFMI
ncbi:MAG: radical SAM protein [SAR324 cluster bacterium]|nr:radical SAM protein [SAR324 cluster bacterium]